MREKHRQRQAAATLLIAVGIGLLGWQMGGVSEDTAEGVSEMTSAQAPNAGPENGATVQEAVFAGGCFWCIEAAFQLMPGVTEAVSGYTWGWIPNPTYQQVAMGTTGHYEAVRVLFDPSVITYEELLEQFWRSIDPTDEGGQFYDRGSQYSTAIIYTTEEQQELAEASKAALEASGVFDKPIVTKILPAREFYVAEDYHQDYFEKHLAQYKAYANASGREAFVERSWEGHEDVSLTGAENGKDMESEGGAGEDG